MSTVPKSKSSFDNRTVYIIIGIAVILALILVIGFVWMIGRTLGGGGSGMTLQSGRETPGGKWAKGEEAAMLKPDEVVKAFFTELSEGQLEDAYQRTSLYFQGTMSQNDFNTFVNKNKPLIGHLSRRTISAQKMGNNTQLIKGHVGGGPNGACDFTLKLARENEGWRITEFTVP